MYLLNTQSFLYGDINSVIAIVPALSKRVLITLFYGYSLGFFCKTKIKKPPITSILQSKTRVNILYHEAFFQDNEILLIFPEANKPVNQIAQPL